MTRSISFQSHQIHVSVEGEGDPIILLHGWPTNSLLWQAQAEALRDQFKVIRLDWLGFGQSDKPLDHSYTFSNMKESLNTVIQAIVGPDEKVNLVAHDIGGPPTLLWASEHPERVRRLILFNTIAYPFKTPLDAVSEWLMHTPLLRDIFVSKMGLRSVMRAGVRSGRKGLRRQFKAILAAYQGVPTEIKLRGIIDPMDHGRTHETPALAEQFRQLEVPKYLVIAKQDPLCFAHVDRLRQENPGVPVYPIERCGHYLAIDQPERVNAALGEILRDGG